MRRHHLLLLLGRLPGQIPERKNLPRTAYDLIIIGGGPAGLTAGVYAATLKMEALLVAKDLGGQAVNSTKIENYLGFDFITGPELIDKFKHHLLQSHYIEHLMSEVERSNHGKEGFRLPRRTWPRIRPKPSSLPLA
jgi:thioredoxin reductase